MNIDCSNNTCNSGWQNNGIIINSDDVIIALIQTIQRKDGLIEMLTNKVIDLENKLLQYDGK